MLARLGPVAAMSAGTAAIYTRLNALRADLDEGTVRLGGGHGGVHSPKIHEAQRVARGIGGGNELL